MSNINTDRSKFFPKSSQNTARTHKNANLLKRNTPTRIDELNSTTKEDAKVQIGDAIKDFSKIKKAVDQAPDIDNKNKIQALKNSINSGTYKIDYEGLADKMLSENF